MSMILKKRQFELSPTTWEQTQVLSAKTSIAKRVCDNEQLRWVRGG